MKKTIIRRIAAGVAVGFSLLTIVEGSQVLLGISHPDYVVLPILVMYNVIMGGVGLVVGAGLWANRRAALVVAAGLSTAHLVVLLIVGVLFASSGSASINSLQAMMMRSGVWILITWVAWRSNRPISTVTPTDEETVGQ
jgi:hypothetical protein